MTIESTVRMKDDTYMVNGRCVAVRGFGEMTIIYFGNKVGARVRSVQYFSHNVLYVSFDQHDLARYTDIPLDAFMRLMFADDVDAEFIASIESVYEPEFAYPATATV